MIEHTKLIRIYVEVELKLRTPSSVSCPHCRLVPLRHLGKLISPYVVLAKLTRCDC